MQADPWYLALSAAIGICMAAGIVVGIEEWVWLRWCGRLDVAARREAKLSLSLLPPNLLASVLLAGVWAALYAQAQRFAPWKLPLNGTTVLAAFLAVEFSYYWEHRCAHRVPVLWASYHAVHHSSSACTVATAYRVSFLSQFFAPAFYLPWPLLGFDPLLVLGLQLLSFHYQAWVHTEMIGDLKPLDGVINTPAGHRVHHSSAAEHRDRNFGAIILLWDRLFGTYAGSGARLRYGIPGVCAPRTLAGIYADPWRRTPDPKKCP